MKLFKKIVFLKIISIFIFSIILIPLISCNTNSKDYTSTDDSEVKSTTYYERLNHALVMDDNEDGVYYLSNYKYLNDIEYVYSIPKTGFAAEKYKYNEEFYKELKKYIDLPYHLLYDDEFWKKEEYESIRKAPVFGGYYMSFAADNKNENRKYKNYVFFSSWIFSNGYVFLDFILNMEDYDYEFEHECYISTTAFDIEKFKDFMNIENLNQYSISQ